MTLSAMIYSQNWIVRVISHRMAQPTSGCNSKNLDSIGVMSIIGEKWKSLHSDSSNSDSIKLMTLIFDFHWVMTPPMIATPLSEKIALSDWHLNNLSELREDSDVIMHSLLNCLGWVLKLICRLSARLRFYL